MKRFCVLIVTLCLLAPCALAAPTDTMKELMTEQLEAMGVENMEDEFPLSMLDVVWRRGGNTQELISDLTWDVAEVSSTEVDLQALTDAGAIWRLDYLCPEAYALNFILKPEIRALVTAKTPAAKPDRMPESARIMAAPVRADGDAVTLLIFNGRKSVKDSRLQEAANYVAWCLQGRSAEAVRTVQTLVLKDGGSTSELIASPNDWDIARVFHKDVDLETLDKAGLLADSRAYSGLAEHYGRLLPKFQQVAAAEDGRMIAMPLTADAKVELLLINRMGSRLQEAADFALWYMEFLHDRNSAYVDTVVKR